MESRRSMHRPPLPQLPPRCPHRPCSGCKTQPRKKPSSDLQKERGRDIRILAPCTVAPERTLRRCSPGLPPRKAKDSHGPWGAPLRRGPKLAQTAPVPPAAPAAPHPAGPPNLPLGPCSGERPPPPRLRRPAPPLWSRSLVKGASAEARRTSPKFKSGRVEVILHERDSRFSLLTSSPL